MELTQFLGGRVLWFSERDGNGVIITNDGTEFYTDTSVIKTERPLKRNDLVIFEHNESIKHCICAKNVQFKESKPC